MAKILLVDDDDNLREILLETLTTAGHSVTSAANGQDAQSILDHQRYDLIVSDVQMPILNGIELLQWIRAQAGTPVILMSGFSRLLELMKPKDIGAMAFLPKPFQPIALVELVEKSLNEKFPRSISNTK